MPPALRQAIFAMSHELNETLTAIAAYLEASRQLLDHGDRGWLDKLHSAMQKAHQQTLRAGGIVKRLRDSLRSDEG